MFRATLFKKNKENAKRIFDIVEKWDPALGPTGPLGLPEFLGPPVPQDPMDPRDPQDLWTHWDLRTSGPLKNYLYVLNSESKLPIL